MRLTCKDRDSVAFDGRQESCRKWFADIQRILFVRKVVQKLAQARCRLNDRAVV